MVKQNKTVRGLGRGELSQIFNRILSMLFGLIIVTVLMHIILQLIYYKAGVNNLFFHDLSNRFGLDEELSFPTWVNSMLAFIGFIFSFFVAKNQVKANKRAVWWLIAIGCLLISIDEVMALHELILQTLHIFANFGESQTWLANAWLLVMPIILIVFIFFMRFAYKNLPKNTFINIVIASVVYLLGALVVEYISIPLDKTKLQYNLVAVVLEESLELIGVWLLIKAVFLHISEHEIALNRQLTELISGKKTKD